MALRQSPLREHPVQNMEHPTRPYRPSLDSFPVKLGGGGAMNNKLHVPKEDPALHKAITYSKDTKIIMDGGDDTIYLVQLGCLF